MRFKTINLEDFVLVGGGRWGESFNHRDNPDIMMKLYALEQKQMAFDEYDRAQKVYGLGIPTPEPGELVKSPDGRMGMIFRRIPDKKSFARAAGENPDEAEKFASRFASMCGEDCRIDEIEAEILPYAAIRAIYIQSLEGRIVPPFQQIVLEAFRF